VYKARDTEGFTWSAHRKRRYHKDVFVITSLVPEWGVVYQGASSPPRLLLAGRSGGTLRCVARSLRRGKTMSDF
jgi:hypothetical protein